MSAGIPTSLELWAAAKVIGRECSAINREFFICKKERGGAPGEFTVCCSNGPPSQDIFQPRLKVAHYDQPGVAYVSALRNVGDLYFALLFCMVISRDLRRRRERGCFVDTKQLVR